MAKKRKNSADKRKLSGNEQKLKATIQQLRASEQQLRAANQQLQAEVSERRKADEQISRQSDVLDAVNRVFHEALTCETKEELGKTCLTVAEQLTNSKFGFIGELNQRGTYDTIAISNPGWDACKMPESEATRLLMNMPLRGIWTRPLKDGKSLMLADPSSHPDSVGTPEGHPPITSFLGVPLKHKDRTFGMFALGNKEGGYDVADKEAAETLSVAIVEALRSKRAEEALRAANQQLQASEQQLRAANQQLQASEQQLKAANQQLQANNQQLRASQEEIRALAKFPAENPNPVLRVAKDGTIIYSNESSSPITELWQCEQGERLSGERHDLIVETLSSGKPQETEAECGEMIYSLTFAPVKDADFVNVYGLDITERKKAAEELRAANQQLQASEQQLKASNQQLQASEQQLRAANQQLQASEQQLRAANQQLQAEVTERMQAEEKIKASLKEKEVLLKEIHHRVKNNMQVISSILNLQSRHIKNKHALEMFEDSQNRIKSMALVHEKLYESEDLANIDFAEYVRSIARYLFGLHEISPRIRSNVDIKDILLDVNTAIPCGLIINELLSNSLKYAFPEGIEGEICIQLSSDKDGKVTLIVDDNGIGFPKDLDFRKTESLGMQLIIMLVEQLEGTVELDKSKGTRFKITFEKPKSKDGEPIKWQV